MSYLQQTVALSTGKPNLLNRQKVQTKTTLSRSSIYELIGRGEFPKPLKISGRRVAWLESAVDAWIQSRIELANT
jgi:prophage regulatory protein